MSKGTREQCPAIKFSLELEGTKPFGGGKSFGKTGPYEWLHGMVHFAIDPNEKDLPFVCDLEFAPRNADGLVEFKAVIDHG